MSGTAMMTSFGMKKSIRGIPIKITTEYFKKVKGTVYATSSVDITRLVPNTDVVVETMSRNKAGEDVAKCSIVWIISAKERKKVQ